MKSLDSGSIDAIVTDPPYGLSAGPAGYIGEKTGGGFMGKDWDSGVPGVPFWQEVLRVAKPGCHILAAGGSRTYHRLAVAIEDAGWEIRDCIMWIYGSGFPKSHDVSKAIDREAGAEREAIGTKSISGMTPTRENFGSFDRSNGKGMGFKPGEIDITTPATEAARQWHGWGTALKPAFEPFILARKPLDGTVAQNVQRHGCGGLNVDGCRVGTDGETCRDGKAHKPNDSGWENMRGHGVATLNFGRWPANVIHDGSDEVMAGFPETTSGSIAEHHKRTSTKTKNTFGCRLAPPETTIGDSGSAARFFYCPKASKSEREAGLDGMEENELQAYGDFNGTDDHSPKLNVRSRNHHPTVKPVALMAYLCRLITPPKGTILDPFCGSGSTGVAAVREGFNFIGIELNPEYAEIATRRIENEKQKTALLK